MLKYGLCPSVLISAYSDVSRLGQGGGSVQNCVWACERDARPAASMFGDIEPIHPLSPGIF